MLYKHSHWELYFLFQTAWEPPCLHCLYSFCFTAVATLTVRPRTIVYRLKRSSWDQPEVISGFSSLHCHCSIYTAVSSHVREYETKQLVRFLSFRIIWLHVGEMTGFIGKISKMKCTALKMNKCWLFFGVTVLFLGLGPHSQQKKQQYLCGMTSIGCLCIKHQHKSLTSFLHQGLSSRNSLPTPQPRRSSTSSSCAALPSLDSGSARWERNNGKRPHPDLNLSR